MNLDSRIPTLFGLAVILAGLAVGTFLISVRQTFISSADPSATPRNVDSANISATAAAIYWQTDKATPGFIQAGTSASALNLVFQDDRDHTALGNHQLHFVTLTNLSPNTTYYYKIYSGGTIYPFDKTLSFKTASPIALSATPPLVGNIIDTGSQPVAEALVILKLPGAQKLAAISKTSGSFVLPLNPLYNETLNTAFSISSTDATLKVIGADKSSTVSLKLPSEPLPPIVLGRDLNVSAPVVSPYDLNSDGVVNSSDLSLLLRNIGKKQFLKQADINGDGAVTQADLQQFTDYFSSQPH